MRISTNISLKIVGVLMSLYFTPVAIAQTATAPTTPAQVTQPGGHHFKGHLFYKCKESLFPNVAKGALTADQKQQIFSCVKVKRAAFATMRATHKCAKFMFPTVAIGQLTADQQVQVNTCAAAKVAAKIAARAQCAKTLNLDLTQKLTKVQRKSLHACMKQAAASPTTTN